MFAKETFENDPQTPPGRTNLVEPTRLYLKKRIGPCQRLLQNKRKLLSQRKVRIDKSIPRQLPYCTFSGAPAHRRAEIFGVHQREDVLDELNRLGALGEKAIESVRD